MQPQDRSTSSSQAPSQEPQLQPLSAWPNQAPQPPKKNPAALIFIIILVLVGTGGAGAFFWWQSNQPKQQQTERSVALNDQQASELYFAAVENHMKTPYIIQKAEQTLGTGSTKVVMKLDAVSDFSDPKMSKTKLVYTAAGEKTPKEDMDVKFEQIALDSALYIKTPKQTPESSPTMYKPDQWYYVAPDNELGKFLLDPLNVAEGINTPLGQVPVGKFNDNVRDELMTFARDNKVYAITGHKAEAVNGQEAQRFTIRLDVKKSEELNEKTAQLLGIKNVLANRPEGTPTIGQFDAWIDRAGKKFKKVHFTISDAGKELGSSTFTFEYPTQAPEITKPADVLDAPRQ